MVRSIRRAVVVAAVAAVAWFVAEWRRARLAGEVPFPGLRRFGNERLDRWVLSMGLAGGRHSEIATLEHVGRKSGTVRYTPVHATFDGEDVWIPLPYGEASEWARNVVAAEGCRLQLHETIHVLEAPLIVHATEDPLLARPVQWLVDALEMRYLRLHRAASVPGAFATHPATPMAAAGPSAIETPIVAPSGSGPG